MLWGLNKDYLKNEAQIILFEAQSNTSKTI